MNLVRFHVVTALMLVAPRAACEEPSPAPFRLPETSDGNLVRVSETDLPSWLRIEDESTFSSSAELSSAELSSAELSSAELSSAESQANSLRITQAIANLDPLAEPAVTRIPSYVPSQTRSHRVVRYEVPLADTGVHDDFALRGITGRLISVEKDDELSSSERWLGFFSPAARRRETEMVQVVRYEVPAEEIRFHAQMQSPTGARLTGEIINPGFMPMPEVRFFQPKARVFMDLKSSNDDEFDLFADGTILASLDVIELHFPMPLVSERLGELLGTPTQLSRLGWRVGGTVGLGIATALNNGTDNGSAPVTTLSCGIRYEFPLGRPSREVLETHDLRLDQRTRVGIEFGIQGGASTRESLGDKTDVGMYFGFQVDTPWGG